LGCLVIACGGYDKHLRKFGASYRVGCSKPRHLHMLSRFCVMKLDFVLDLYLSMQSIPLQIYGLFKQRYITEVFRNCSCKYDMHTCVHIDEDT
jgi:hypothetical protein